MYREELKRIEKYESNKKEEETREMEETLIKQKPWILYVFAVASALVIEVRPSFSSPWSWSLRYYRLFRRLRPRH